MRSPLFGNAPITARYSITLSARTPKIPWDLEHMRELYELSRRLGIRVPIFHNDVAALSGRQLEVDLLAIDRYPITRFDDDWRTRPNTFDDFAIDEDALDAHGRLANPVFYPELQAGWYDGWGGVGYAQLRERLGADSIDATTKAAVASRGTLWNYYVYCGGVTCGYLASPDVYSSYDYGAPIAESGATDSRHDAVRSLNRTVATISGSMFAPRPELVAAELRRVCRPGGTIAMGNWTKDGFVGQMFKTVARDVPARNMPPPVLWGDEPVVRERFGPSVATCD